MKKIYLSICICCLAFINAFAQTCPTMTSSNSMTICSGVTVNIALSADVSSTFTWIAADNINTTGESTTMKTTSTISDALTNNSTSTQTVTYTVTPTATAGGCVGTTQIVSITVVPKDDASFSYTPSTFCTAGGIDPTATITGASGGTFSCSDANLAINSSTGLITIASTPVGTYTVTYTTAGQCSNAGTFVVTIVTIPDATFAYGTYCQNATPNPFPTQPAGATTGVFTTPAGIVFVSTTSGQVDLSASTPGAYTATNTIAATSGGCPAATFTNTITINSAPFVNVSSATICAGNSATLSDVGGGAATYLWSDGSTASSLTASPATTTSYTVTGTTGGCSSSAVGTITVNTCTTTSCSITLANGSGSALQSVCKNSAITPIVFNVTVTTNGYANITATLPTGVSGTYNASTQQYTISGTPSSEGTFDYTVTTQGSCASQSSLSGTLTVGLGLTAGSGTLLQSICKNSSITPIVFNVVGGSASITATLPPNVSGVYNAGTQQYTISGTPSGEGTFDYTVQTQGSCATQSSLSGTLTVGLGLTATSGALNQSVCKNTAITDIVLNIVGGGSGASVSATLPIGVSAIYNAGTQQYTISGTPSVEGTFDYTVQTTGSCFAQSSFSGTLLVGIGLAAGSGTISQNVCKNSSITPMVFNVIGGGASVTPTIPAGVMGIYNAGTQQYTISGTPSVVGSFNYTLTTTGSCLAQSSLTGNIISNSINVNILSTNESSLNACDGYLEATAKVAVPMGVPTFTYLWSDSSTVNSPYRYKECSGNYSVTVTSSGCSATAQAHIGSNATRSTIINPLTISVSSKDVSNSAVCDGSAVATVKGGVPPYNINFAGNTVIGATYAINNLCAGFYTVNTTDANSDSASFTFVVASPITIYPFILPIFIDSTIIDTLVTNARPNCIINYSIIDSITITNFSFVGLNSVNVIWTVFQAGGLTNTQNANYQFSLPGLYTFVLDLFCTNRVSGSARATDQLYISKSALGIEQYGTSNITVYPNPFNNQLYIVVDKTSSIKITDIIGRQIYSGTVNTGGASIDAGNFNSGVYFITISNGKNVVTKKLIKN